MPRIWVGAPWLGLVLLAVSSQASATSVPQQPSVGAAVDDDDRTPPTGTVTINDGATYTTTAAVTLMLSATDDSGAVSQMQCSNDGVTYEPPEPYATTKNWTLASGDGTKTAYVKFSDPPGNWSQSVSDTIILDTTPPVVQITDPVDGQIFGAQ